MKNLALMALLALASCTVVHTDKQPPQVWVAPWPKPPECTFVNNTGYALEVYLDGRPVASALAPGQVLAVPGDHAALAVVAHTQAGELVGSAFHHYWFRGEVWVLTTVTKLHEN